MQFPMFTIAGRIVKDPGAYSDLSLPMLGIVVESGSESLLRVPKLSISATASCNELLSLQRTMPRLQLSALAYASNSLNLGFSEVKNLPMLSVSASASESPITALERHMPMLRISSSATAGQVVSLIQNLPIFRLDARAFCDAVASIEQNIPMLELVAHIRSAYVAMSLNPRSLAFSTYSAYDYGGVALFNGQPIAISKTGLYELSGDKDGSLEIPWVLRTGKIDIQHSHLRQVWITGDFGEEATFAVEDVEGNRYEYKVNPWSDTDNEVRVKLGKNIRTRYAIFELSGRQPAAIDQIRVFGVKGGKGR